MKGEGKFTYAYARAGITADLAVLRLEELPEILLIQRRDPPFEGMWALPGGFMEMEETLEETAKRELLEETGVIGSELIRFDTYDQPCRDPRGRTITQVFVMIWKAKMGTPRAGSDAKTLAWFKLSDLPELAFDHSLIIQDVINMMKNGAK